MGNLRYEVLIMLRMVAPQPLTYEALYNSIPFEELPQLLRQMEKEKLVYKALGGYGIAGDVHADDDGGGGWLYLDLCISHPIDARTERAFRDEVLLGITEAGKPTRVSHAALPSPDVDVSTGQVKDPEHLFFQQAYRQRAGQGESIGARHRRRIQLAKKR